MPQMFQVLRERVIGMLTAGMSTRAIARELNVHFSTISRLQRHFREFGSTCNRSHNRRPRVTTPAQNLHIQHLHLQDHLRPATQTNCQKIGATNVHVSAQTVRNRLHEDGMRARRPQMGVVLTAQHRAGCLAFAREHQDWQIRHWRPVLFTVESRFTMRQMTMLYLMWLECVSSSCKMKALKLWTGPPVPQT
uniref:Transposase Tc1-like domain-containing protein n=1 Tax=Pygocentrus nattereri TaxID=42514 RepID=A0AAR2KGV7_PYGNA